MCAFEEFHEMYEYNSIQILMITCRLIYTMKWNIHTFHEKCGIISILCAEIDIYFPMHPSKKS